MTTAYSQQELALRLRKRQAELLERIKAEDPKAGVTHRLQYLARAKEHVDSTLADLAEELGWQDGYHRMLDHELAQRDESRRVWGQ